MLQTNYIRGDWIVGTADTPMDPNVKFSKDDGLLFDNPGGYRRLVEEYAARTWD